MKNNGPVFNRLSEVDSLLPGGGVYANVTWKCRKEAPKMTFVLLDSWRVKG